MTYPDPDPQETAEWVAALDDVISVYGAERATSLLAALATHAHTQGIAVSGALASPYRNTIRLADQPPYPGDLAIEKRLRAFTRWNAMAMVIRANRRSPGIGGHLATYASASSLLEVGFNHFFRGRPTDPTHTAPDQVFFQGHAAPGVYARAYLEGRLSDADLDAFRAEATPGNAGLSSYPHPRTMPDFWEFSTVSMGLGPLAAIHQARTNRFLEAQGLLEGSGTVWCFVGDGEMDEPESTTALAMAAREGLSNLVFVVNCNLQRLDGPVRGNAKIINELEGIFAGAGWNVVKVVWGAGWDPLLAADTDGVLLAKLTATNDGEYQRLATLSGAEVREQFFGTDPRLAALVADLTDRDLELLPRGGHDSTKIAAAYQAALDEPTRPTAILAKTVKGWALGPAIEARNATHQIKKMTASSLTAMAARLGIADDLAAALAGQPAGTPEGVPPYLRPTPGSPEAAYLAATRAGLGAPVPARAPAAPPVPLASRAVFDELDAGSNGVEVSTTMAFVRGLRGLMKDSSAGLHVVPIVSDEARTFGMEALIAEMAIYDPAGMRYRSVDAGMQLAYKESTTGRIIQEGISEADGLAELITLGTSYATHDLRMLPIFLYYSMFGFQRVGDAIWQATDMRARGILAGGTAGRTTLEGEGLQHDDGHSLLLASTNPAVRAYDPSFAYEIGIILEAAATSILGSDLTTPQDAGDEEDLLWYLTLYNEPYAQPPIPTDRTRDELVEGVLSGIYRLSDLHAPPTPARRARRLSVSLLASGPAWRAAHEARDILMRDYAVDADLWSATSLGALRRDALEVERYNRLHPSATTRTPIIASALGTSLDPVVCVTDHMRAEADLVSRAVARPWTTLGTDGFGLSDDRAHLRAHFEVTAGHVVVAALAALVDQRALDRSRVTDAITRFGIDPDTPSPFVG